MGDGNALNNSIMNTIDGQLVENREICTEEKRGREKRGETAKGRCDGTHARDDYSLSTLSKAASTRQPSQARSP